MDILDALDAATNEFGRRLSLVRAHHFLEFRVFDITALGQAPNDASPQSRLLDLCGRPGSPVALRETWPRSQ